MIESLNDPNFFTPEEQQSSRALGIWPPDGGSRRAFASLMLTPPLEISMQDSVTSPQEFEAIESYMREIEEVFELATREEMEEVGTDMGLLPMIPSRWSKDQFAAARTLLASALERLPEKFAHDVRNAIARACLDVARVSSGRVLHLHVVSSNERPLIHRIALDLQLDRTAEGLHLLGKTGQAR